ncbi:MAG: nuclear transport factor 2 family protein [Bacteroidota bacterium]
MKQILFILILFLIYSCETKGESNTIGLEETIKQFNEAFNQGNTDVLSKMITDNYTHTNSSWKSFGKEQWMKYMIKRKEKISKGKLLVDQYVMDELAIEFFEDSAIVTARISTSGVDDGNPFIKQFRVTNLWVLQEGKWLRAGFHDTLIN